MLTLQEAKVGMRDKVAAGVVDTFQRESFLMDAMPYDDAVAAGGHGSTLVYGYQQLQTPSVAGVRKINEEYTPGEAKRVEKTAKLCIMGGSFQLDRVVIGTSGEVDELEYQVNEKVKATRNEFHNLIINGSSAASGSGYVLNTFDGLKKLLTGSAQAFASEADVSTSALVTTNGQALLDEIDALVARVPGCNILIMGLPMLLKVRAAARRAGYYDRSVDGFGRQVETYNGIPMVDAGKYYNGTNEVDVIPVDATAGTTAIYAAKLALDGLHGICPLDENAIVRVSLPDLSAPGAVKTGDVELVAGIALKNIRAAGVLTGVKVKATT